MANRLQALIADIGDLFEQSELEEYVDTGDALELLGRALEALTEAQAALNAMAAADDTRSCPYCDKDDWGVEQHEDGCPYRSVYRTLGDLDQNLLFANYKGRRTMTLAGMDTQCGATPTSTKERALSARTHRQERIRQREIDANRAALDILLRLLKGLGVTPAVRPGSDPDLLVVTDETGEILFETTSEKPYLLFADYQGRRTMINTLADLGALIEQVDRQTDQKEKEQ